MGDRLRAERKQAGLSQEELGALAGVSKAAISALETGKNKEPAASTLEPICRRLNLSPRWLLDGKPPKHPSPSQAMGFDFSKIIQARKLLGQYLKLVGDPEELQDDPERLRLAYEVIDSAERESRAADIVDLTGRLRERLRTLEETNDGNQRREADGAGKEDGGGHSARARKTKAQAG